MRPLLAVLLLAACGADPSPVPPDAARDAAPDAPPAVDVVADEPAPPPDLPAPDASAPDASPPAPDDGPDAAPDARADAGPDAPRDVAGELADARPDADPLLEQVTAVRVTVRTTGYDWATPRAQSCAVASGTIELSAEYGAPEPLSLAAMGSAAGPTVMTVVGGGSDVRATARLGAEYTIGGTRRVNVALHGEPRAGLVLDVTALGCVVR